MKKITFIIIACLLHLNAAQPKLKLVNVLFRHGDRTPTHNAIFPTDPNYNSTFYPFGYGALTSSGKLRAYKLGELLRDRYQDFVGDVYLPKLIYARSTDYDRTKMSLQLVLAAIFPPTDVQKWHETIKWQPIPITYFDKINDDLLGTMHKTEFRIEKKRIEEDENLKKRIKNLQPFMTELSYLTGKEISNAFDVKKVYDTLIAESYMNLTTPIWWESDKKTKLYEGTLLDYDIISYDKSITRVISGELLSKIAADILLLKNNTNLETKLYLYSGHDVNIVGLLKSLNIYEPHEPKYTSAIIIELLEEYQKYYLKVLYYRGIPSLLEELQIPGCSLFCPLENFLLIVQ